MPASLAYSTAHPTNPAPFLLSPILNLPPSFGSAYVGETFSCTLCANHEIDATAALLPPAPQPTLTTDPQQQQQQQQPDAAAQPPPRTKFIRDVRIEAEMKTPSIPGGVRLDLAPRSPAAPSAGDEEQEGEEGKEDGEKRTPAAAAAGVDLDPGQTLQRVVSFDLKDEGTHVLGVTVSYYEATATSGRARTFRKLYQFVCKPSLIVRTKAGLLPARGPAPLPPSSTTTTSPPPPATAHHTTTTTIADPEKAAAAAAAAAAAEEPESQEGGAPTPQKKRRRRRWVLEAQLENCSEDTMQLERVALDLEPGLACHGCNWEQQQGQQGQQRPVLHPAEVEQVCFVIEERDPDSDGGEGGGSGGGGPAVVGGVDAGGKVVFGVLSIGWRGEMGSRGHLTTGKLGTRHVG